MSRDSWERLVVAVLRSEELRELARAPSLDPSEVSSRFSFSAISSDLNSRLSFSTPPHEHVPVSHPQASSRVLSKTSNSSDRSSISIPSYSGKSSIDSLPTPRSEAEILSSAKVKSFSFNELKNATRNFRPDSIIGEGVFGYVFKGRIDENLTAAKPGSGIVIAVKMLKPDSFQGHKEWLVRPFLSIVQVRQLHHPNLVKLIGYCSEGDNRLLVYEFMPKGSLENHLFRDPIKSI